MPGDAPIKQPTPVWLQPSLEMRSPLSQPPLRSLLMLVLTILFVAASLPACADPPEPIWKVEGFGAEIDEVILAGRQTHGDRNAPIKYRALKTYLL
jgi:hypothetical protein